jgi:hypothetical protein
MPGTRWVARKGPHVGNEVEVVKLTGGNRVVVRHIGGEGAAWSKDKSEATGLATLGRDVFLANYIQSDQLGPADARGGRAFRRYAAKPAAAPTNGATELPRAPAELRIAVETITPDMALAWLERGGANRNLNERRVERYKTIMLRGEWQLTGEAIKLDADACVRDGQHRLEAICRAGIPIQSVVVRNLPAQAFDVLDNGASRSPADVLGIHGVPQRAAMAAAARGLILIERFGRYETGGWSDEAVITGPETLAYVNAHPELLDAVRLAGLVRIDGFLGGAGLWAVAIALLIRKDRDAAELFVEALRTGANLTPDSSVLKLRNMLKTAPMQYAAAYSTRRGRETVVALIIKAWNFWRRGEGISALHWRSEGRSAEPFPTPE